jgi:sRNA-binding protein
MIHATHRPGGWMEQAKKWAKSIQDKNAERAREAEERRLMALEDRNANPPSNPSNPARMAEIESMIMNLQIKVKNSDENMSDAVIDGIKSPISSLRK